MKKNLYVAERAQAAVARNGSYLNEGFSQRANAIFDRYLLIMDAEPLVTLTDDEMNAVTDALWATVLQNAESNCDIASEVEDALEDGLAEKWSIDGPALVVKLDAMPVVDRVRILEEVELRRAPSGMMPG